MSAIDLGGDNTMMHPARYAAAVTPSDTVDLAYVTRGIYVGSGGDVEVVMVGNGATVVFPGVPDGVILPVRATRIKDSNTTASSIVAIW
jgi:endonuclease YncB( thermonuclease family)